MLAEGYIWLSYANSTIMSADCISRGYKPKSVVTDVSEKEVLFTFHGLTEGAQNLLLWHISDHFLWRVAQVDAALRTLVPVPF